jgi:hypothetical protein
LCVCSLLLVAENQVHDINKRLREVMGADMSALGLAAGADAAAFLGMGQIDAAVSESARRGEYRLLYITEKMLFQDCKAEGMVGGALAKWCDVLARLHREGRLLLVAVDETDVVITWPENNLCVADSGFPPEPSLLLLR